MNNEKMEEAEILFNLNNPLKIGSYNKYQETPYLYHYTSTDALKNIIANKRFWMSNCMFLNDSAEIKYTMSLIKDFCDKRGNLPALDELLKVYSETANDSFNQFVLSTSYEKDNLTLWYNYGDNDGYNIEIDNKAFSEGAMNKVFGIVVDGDKQKETVSGSFLQDKVIYDVDNQKIIVNEIIDYYLGLMSTANNEDEKNVIIIRSIHNLLVCSLFFKDPAFFQEAEYRFVLNVHNGLKNAIKYRTSSGCIIPYCELGIGIQKKEKLPIRSITIGPRNKSDIAEAGLKNYLNYYGYENVQVQKTKIPLRY